MKDDIEVHQGLSDDRKAVIATRLRLLGAGFAPLPLYGKEPPVYGKNNKRGGLGGWQKLNPFPEQVEMWSKTWPDSINTGILTRTVPTFDVDILNPEAASAVEEMIRNQFEAETGRLLCRIGLPPKRAFLFRTDVPFEKITINLVASDGSAGQKLEFLGDGQQVVVDGIHPDTQQPYTWFGGSPDRIKREELPVITAEQARDLMEKAADLLVKDFGYVRTADRPKGNGASGGSKDWEFLYSHVQDGEALHDSTRDLAMKLVASGMHPGAATNLLRAIMNSSSTPRDERWQDRYDDIPNLVNSAVRKVQFIAATRTVGAIDPDEDDIKRLNRIHAILPIGGKTRVITLGEKEDFPGRETIVMTQTIDDFKSLNNKYRHEYQDSDGVLQSIPMGNYWISSTDRRQYDGGMAFMPRVDGDVSNKMNLWRGFGVRAIKGECGRFLGFTHDIICSGNDEHYDYLIKREAIILQKRIRTEVALCLQTREEGAGKGFYERVMRRLTGHAMQLSNPKHIVGAFNPHLEDLLRLTADEALFVHNPEHRNALFNLVTEKEMTIEPKNCGIYSAESYLNLSIISNSEHFVPVSDTARRFFIPTVWAKRRQDFKYFAELQAELDHGGYEALLFYLLHEIDLTGFNVREIPKTEGLRRQRNLSLQPLDAWWCELLETGILWGSDPTAPDKAVSNSFQRVISVGTYVRTINQPGLYDQARQLEPRLKKNWANDGVLGDHLKKMGCDNKKKVLRRRGWSFPKLSEARAKWVERYPQWEWRNPDLADWQAEESDDGAAAATAPDDEDIPF